MLFQSVIWLCGSLFPLSGPADRPPPANFDKPPDYKNWLRGYISKDRTENAAELYAGFFPDDAGKGGLPEPSEKVKPRIEALVAGPSWKGEDDPDLAEYLKSCGPYIETLRTAVQRPDYWIEIPQDDRPVFGVVLPQLNRSRAAVKAMIVLAWKQQTNPEAQVRDFFELALKHANQMQGGGTLGYALVGISERALVFEAIRAALGEGILRGADAAETQRVVQKSDRETVEPTRAYMFEWAATLDTLHYVCPNGRYDPAKAKRLSSPGQPDLIRGEFDPSATAKLIDEHYQGLIKIASGAPSGKKAKKLADFEEKQSSLHADHAFLRPIIPSFNRSFELMLRAEAERRGTLLTLAIQTYHRKHDKWPEKLAQLELEGKNDIKKDPYSEKPFIYKLEDDKPVLYSVGRDGDDDGGRHDPHWGEGDEGGDYLFWPFQRSE